MSKSNQFSVAFPAEAFPPTERTPILNFVSNNSRLCNTWDLVAFADMNNTQFRSLLLGTNVSGSSPTGQGKKVTATPSQSHSATPMLGSRARSSIPMTPRSVAGYSSSNDFARQLAEHKRELSGQPPTKKFRSTAAPKGTKLAQGYQDRTSLRRADGEDA